ncbi:MAG: hypothetical protein K6C09_10410 [Oscillospiraceae bacterium]|nr:hypothetical protein [Oscillospiraceae bacterium]
MLFQSNEKHELIRIAYARAGCYFFLQEDYFRRILKLSGVRSGDMTQISDMSFYVHILDGDKPERYHYYGDEGSLCLISPARYVDVALTADDEIRFRGAKNAGLRLELASNMEGNGAAALDSIVRLKDGSVEGVFGKHGNLRFVPIRGKVEYRAEYDCSLGRYAVLEVDMLPDEEGRFEVSMQSYFGTPVPEVSAKSFEEIQTENRKSFADFFANYTDIPEKYRTMAEEVVYVTWSHVMKPAGFVKSPMIMMHYNCLAAGFSWQQSYNGMALQGNPQEGFRLIANMFLYQNPLNGCLPSTVSPGNVGDFGCQPPLQGFALNLLVRRCGEEFITAEMAGDLLPKFEKWIAFWTTYRTAGRGDDLIQINNPNESGWDDASTYKDGFPVSNSDTMALLIECMYACSMLARRAGDPEREASWKERGDRLLNTLITEFWDGEKFVTKLRGKAVDSMSLACYQPILLGDRLPKEITRKIAEKLLEEGSFMTPMGLCTESMKSPMCHWGWHFVLGRVVAPANMFCSVGLWLAGEKEAARKIASAWCDNVAEKGPRLGFKPYNVYPLTGEPADTLLEPQVGDGWIWCGWSACNTMTMLQVVLADKE